MKKFGLKKTMFIFLVLTLFTALAASYYYFNHNSTNVPKSATLVKCIIGGSDTIG